MVRDALTIIGPLGDFLRRLCAGCVVIFSEVLRVSRVCSEEKNFVEYMSQMESLFLCYNLVFNIIGII